MNTENNENNEDNLKIYDLVLIDSDHHTAIYATNDVNFQGQIKIARERQAEFEQYVKDAMLTPERWKEFQ